jgi:ABC-type lipoprotein export system ATPase subunit
VLVITHDQRLVPFANRVIHIEDGRILGEDRRKVATPFRTPRAAVAMQDALAAD